MTNMRYDDDKGHQDNFPQTCFSLVFNEYIKHVEWSFIFIAKIFLKIL